MPDREIVTARLIDAPGERILEAFSDPAHLTCGRGPKGFTSAFRELLLAGDVLEDDALRPRRRQLQGTALTWRMFFPSAADCDKVKRFAVDANEQNLDRLEVKLSRMG